MELSPEEHDVRRLPSQRAVEGLRVVPDVRDQDTGAPMRELGLDALDDIMQCYCFS